MHYETWADEISCGDKLGSDFCILLTLESDRHLCQVLRQGISSRDLSSTCGHFSAEFRLGCNLPAHLQMVTKITVDGDGSQDIKRCLLLGRKAMSNLDSILKSRDVTLPTKSVWSKLWFFQ